MSGCCRRSEPRTNADMRCRCARKRWPSSTQCRLITGEKDFVFTSSQTRRLGNFSHAKLAIDARMKPVTPWVLHDLPAHGGVRNGASRNQAAGDREDLNHASGTFRGIVGVYQRHDFAAEKRDALARWADHVDAIVRGEPAGKVVKLRG